MAARRKVCKVFNKEVLMHCPFCQEKDVLVLEKAGYKGFKTSRGSGRSNTFAVSVKGGYVVITGCKKCGKTKTEVEKGLFG